MLLAAQIAEAACPRDGMYVPRPTQGSCMWSLSLCFVWDHVAIALPELLPSTTLQKGHDPRFLGSAIYSCFTASLPIRIIRTGSHMSRCCRRPEGQQPWDGRSPITVAAGILYMVSLLQGTHHGLQFLFMPHIGCQGAQGLCSIVPGLAPLRG